jgi:hypothetical protein
MSGLPVLDHEKLLAIAGKLTIDNKKTGTRTKWVPTREQARMAAESAKHPWLLVAKPRQVYASTWFCFEDVLWTATADARGHRVYTAIVVDTDPKASARLDVCEDFAVQLGLPVRRLRGSNNGPERMTFPNGSRIVAFSAGGRRAGSSLSFHRFHFTELPYWQHASQAYGSLMPALAKSEDAQCKIETTMDVTEDPLARNLWVTDNRYRKLFFGVEDHEDYRADPGSISDDRWAELQAEGYTERSAAAWFDHALHDECGGDSTHAYRLYPQRPEHMFQLAEGLLIRKMPHVTEPIRRIVAEGESEHWFIDVHVEPADTSGQLVIGVDTAAGKGRDYSTIAVIDKRDFRICASFQSDQIWGDDLARVAKVAQKAYTRYFEAPIPIFSKDPAPLVPLCVIEDNGVGMETYHSAVRQGVKCVPLHMDEATRLAALLWVKRHTENGRLYGPDVLAAETQSLHRDAAGRFKGRKDFCMALGMAGWWTEHRAPFVAANEGGKKGRFDLKAKLRASREPNRPMGY